jgi:ribokinase
MPPPDPSRAGHIVVVGSANLDMTLQTKQFPKPGETVRGQSLTYAPGGKGANQAVAAARLGARVRMVSRVGDDAAGGTVLKNLADNGVETGHVRTADGVPQGIAVILLDGNGQNVIVLAEGSNGKISPADVDAARAAFDGVAIAILQNEIPMETTVRAAQAARAAGARVLWNPAPAPDAPPEGMAVLVDVIVLNESEAEALTGIPVQDAAGARRAGEALLAAGYKAAVLTLGEAGALWVDERGAITVAANPVEVMDTTGAGDTFAGALAVALAEGQSPEHALRFANAAAGLSVSRLGAQAGMPTRVQVEQSRAER